MIILVLPKFENISNFVNQAKNLHLKCGYCYTSYIPICDGRVGGYFIEWHKCHFVESIHYSDHFVNVVITLMETFDEVSFIT